METIKEFIEGFIAFQEQIMEEPFERIVLPNTSKQIQEWIGMWNIPEVRQKIKTAIIASGTDANQIKRNLQKLYIEEQKNYADVRIEYTGDLIALSMINYMKDGIRMEKEACAMIAYFFELTD